MNSPHVAGCRRLGSTWGWASPRSRRSAAASAGGRSTWARGPSSSAVINGQPPAVRHEAPQAQSRQEARTPGPRRRRPRRHAQRHR
eukprot:1947672-Pyramimonas_sp.AAC.1